MEQGELAPDFELRDENGTPRRLTDYLRQGRVVLFFYPRALSAGCTAESSRFRDLGPEFAELGAQPIGISSDDVKRQHDFAARKSLGMPLLSDPNRTVADQFGVKRRFGPSPVKRWTFLIDRDRRILEVIKSETRMAHHAERALEAMSNLG